MSDSPPASAAPAAEGGVARRVMLGAALYVAANLAVRVMGVLTIALLGRLLTPWDFGVVALAMVAVGLAEALVNRQFELALVRIPAIEDSHYDTAFTLAAGWALTASAVIVAVAWPVAELVGEPALGPVLACLALAPALNGLSSAHFVRHQRALNFAPGLIVSVVAKLAASLLGIAVAFATRDYWALVVATVAYFAIRTALTYVWTPRRPRLSLRWWREFLRFGGWLGAAGAMEFANQKLVTALLGARLGAAPTGLYHMGSEVAQMATTQLTDPLMRAVYPGLAAIASDPARLRAAYRKAQATILGALLPIGVGVALTAPEAVRLLIGPQWAAAVPVIQILAPVMAVGALTAGVQATLMAQGDTRSIFFRNLVILGVQLPILGLGLWAFGLLGAVAARAVATLVQTALTLEIARRVTGEGPVAQAMVGRRSFIACAVMTVAVAATGAELGGWPEAAAAALEGLVVKAAVGAAAYCVAHWALWRAAGRPDGFERAVADQLGRLRDRLARGAQ